MRHLKKTQGRGVDWSRRSFRSTDRRSPDHRRVEVVFVDLAGSERVGKSGVVADGTNGARAFSLPGNVKVDLPGTRLGFGGTGGKLGRLGRVGEAINVDS